MARPYFGRGARGAIIQRIQEALTAAGFDTNGHDGIYGGDTAAAVTAFQKVRGLRTALCSDIHVQNGGIKESAAKRVRSRQKPGVTEAQVRLLIANAVADKAKPEWRENVRRRKVTIATGSGTANGIKAKLKNWGLDEFEVR